MVNGRRNALQPRTAGAPFAALKRLFMSVICGRGAGTEFSQSAVEGLQPGIMTYEQVSAELGEAYGVSTDLSGKKLAVWSYVGPSATRAVAIAFTDGGVMERVVIFREIRN